MKKGSNIHAPATLLRAYGTRDWRWYQPLLASVIRNGKPGTILDIGSGLGLFMECAQRWRIKCIGLEGSEFAVKKTKKRMPDLDIRHHFLEDRFPLKGESIDTVLCYQTIEHLFPETAKFIIKESHRVLCKNGIIMIYSPSIYNKKESEEETHINMYSPKRLRDELSEVGFVNIRSEDIPQYILGPSKIGKLVAQFLFRCFPIERLSLTANCIAQKL